MTEAVGSTLDRLAAQFAGREFATAVQSLSAALHRHRDSILGDSVEAAEHVQAWLADPCEVNERLVRAIAEQLSYKGIWGSVCAAIVWREGANMIDPDLGIAPAPKGLSEKMLAAAVLSAAKDDPSLLVEFGAV
jgi:hypothetical protein